MKNFIILFFVLITLSGFGQKMAIIKKEITPKGISSIGGISFYNGKLYLLLPANIRFGKKEAEASETKTITQKYQVWDVYFYDPDSGKLENKSSQWKTADASPNGFSILNDSTVIYINSRMKLESNKPDLNLFFRQLNRNKASFTDPYSDSTQHRIYFSSDLVSQGNMDLWYIETGKNVQFKVLPAGNMNTPFNEISPSLPNDSTLVFSSNSVGNHYDICFWDLKKNKLIYREDTPAENEYFTLSPKNELFYFMIPTDKRQTLWKGVLSVRNAENIETISTKKVEEIPQSNVETGMEMPREDTNEDLEIKMKNYFGSAKFQLTPFMQDSLSRLAKLLKNNPDLKIVICGHASPDGPDNLNMMLSYYRANEAYKCLIANQVDEKRIFRIYAGENLISDAFNARMFSIFTTTESDLPGIEVVYRLKENEKKEEILKRFGSNTDEMEYVKYATKQQLPVGGANIILIPVKDIHIVKKGETLYSMAIQYGIKLQALIEANHITPESFRIGNIILIPGQ